MLGRDLASPLLADHSPKPRSAGRSEAEAPSSSQDAHSSASTALHLSLAVALVLAGLSGVALVGDSFSLPSVYTGYTGVISWANFSGVILQLFVLPIGLTFLGLSVTALVRSRTPTNAWWTALLLAVLGLGCIVWSVVSWTMLIRPANTFSSSDPADALQQLEGGFYFAIFAPLGVTILAIAVRTSLCPGAAPSESRTTRARPRGGSSSSAGVTAPGDIQPVRCCSSSGVGACALLLLIAALVAATSILTNVWNFSAKSYLPYISPYSLLNLELGPNVVTKVYEDVVVYFSMLTLLVLLGLASRFVPAVNGVATRRLPVCGSATGWWNPWAHGITVGELAVVVWFLALFGYWIHYWGFKYQRIASEAQADPESEAQVVARVLGHMTTLVMSVLAMPAARFSLWESALGVPFERAIKYHRMLGGLAWCLVTAHMLVWMGKWARQGLLWNNVITIDNLRIDPFTSHWDNFTVLVAETAWLILTVSVITAALCRRANYEAFYYLHQYAGILFFVVGVWHAWGFWYYGAGGMILWLVDRLARLWRGTRDTRLLSLEHAGGVTRVVLSGDSFTHYAGQYVFLCIPAIDEWQWHPFTISSPPTASRRTLHIKDMGESTWTGQLARLATFTSAAVAAGASPASVLPRICVDAPYGLPRDYTRKRSLLLVAGGIGITPMHSIFADLYERACQPDVYGSLGPIRHVRLVWVVRFPSEANAFAETIYKAETHNPGGIFQVQVYCTNLSPKGSDRTRGSEARALRASGMRSPLAGVTPRSAGFDTPEIEIEASAGRAALPSDHTHDTGPMRPAATDEDTAEHLPPFADVSSEAVTHVQSSLRGGRPPLARVFADVAAVDASIAAAVAASSTPAARALAEASGAGPACMVLACGPRSLLASVSDLAFEHSFAFHEEEFYF